MPAISVAFAHDLAGFNGGEGCWMRPAPCERAMLASIQAAGWTSLTQTLGG